MSRSTYLERIHGGHHLMRFDRAALSRDTRSTLAMAFRLENGRQTWVMRP